MANYIIERIEVNKHILDDEKYTPIFSVEKVNQLAASGVPFRDAYKQVGLEIEAGKFSTDKKVCHTHEGSIGNLCTEEIALQMQNIIQQFNFTLIEEAENKLLNRS